MTIKYQNKKMLMAAAAMLLAGAAQAQSAGSNLISLGWFRVMPTGSADPLTLDSINGMPLGQPQPGTGAKVEAADTLGIAFTHFFTDNIAGEIVAGVPPKHDISGEGVFAQYGKLGSVRQWSPAVLVQYHFFDAKAKIRPYVGIGVNYTWFTEAQVTNQSFVSGVYGPGATLSASAKPSWNPVFNIGANYAINDKWFVGLSVSYLPLSTTATFTTQRGPVTLVSHTKIKLDPVVTYLNVSYRF